MYKPVLLVYYLSMDTTTDPFPIDSRVNVDSDSTQTGTVTAFRVNEPRAYVQLDAADPFSPILIDYSRLTRI